MSNEIFEKALAESGMPITETSLKQAFQQVAIDEGVELNNSSEYSPFWRMILSIVTLPVMWLQQMIVSVVMPNSYVQFAVDGFLDLLGSAVDLDRKTAQKLTGIVTFERLITGQPLLIQAGTIIKTAPISGAVYRVIVSADTSFTALQTSINVPVIAEAVGSRYNLSAGYFSILNTPISGVTRVFNPSGWITSPGADIESNDNFRLRIRNQFSAVNQYHTDAVYRSIIAGQTGFATDRIYFEHDAPRGPGTANAFILFDAGVPGTEYINQVNDYISTQGYHGHGDDLLVQAMPETTHDISLTVYVPDWVDADTRTALQSDVDQFIRIAFREAVSEVWKPSLTWPWDRFSFSLLGRELHREFSNISSINWGQTDIVSLMTIPRLNSLTITIEDE